MRLKSLEIQGFKSFANKSFFEFDQGITAIVGPNGSGKSNIADAIRWVLGEQSYTSMRAQKTADMIFSGSTSKARLGMAYVSLVLDNSDGSMPIDYSEVTIARRAFRSGENEYLINNNRVRLKDVAELLARGGLARQTYTLVGQGTIDRALSLRAGERRQLFEEAAGITYHRQRRHETLRRLDETRQNLLRLNDIVKEIEPRLRRLERQAERYEEHQKIRRHLDGLLKIWYGYLWGQGQQALHRARIRETIGKERLTEEQEKLTQIEAQIGQLRTQQTELRGQLGDWHGRSSKIHSQAEALQRELAVNEERTRQLTAQREEFVGDIQQLTDRLHSQQTEVEQAQTALVEAEQDYQTARAALHAAESQLADHESRRTALLKQQRQAEEQGRRAGQQLTDRQSRLSQLAERLKELKAQTTEQQAAIEGLQTKRIKAEQALQQAQNQRTDLETRLDELNRQHIAEVQKRQTLLQEAKILAAKLANEDKQLASLQARQDLLARLRSDLSGYHSGVKAVLQAKSLAGIRGPVAQLVEVPAHLETAIEASVGGRLQEVVVDSWPSADAAIQYLKKQQAGRATFLPLDSLRPPEALIPPSSPGVIGLAADLITFDQTIAPAVESIFNRLLIVEDLAAAKAAFDALRGSFQIATRAGEIVRSGGSVSGGNSKEGQSGSSFLAREREWRELPQQIAVIEEQIKAIRFETEQNQADQAATEKRIEQLEQAKVEVNQKLNQAQQAVNHQAGQLSEIDNQISWQSRLIERLAQEMETIQANETTFRAEIERLTQERTKAEDQAAALQAEVATLSAEAILVAVNQAKTDAALQQEKQENRRSLLKNFTNNRNQTQAQLDQRQTRVKALTDQREALLIRSEEQRTEHKRLVETIKGFTDQIEPAEAALSELETNQAALEETEERLRAVLRRQEAEAGRYSLELARQQDRMNELQRQIEDDFGLVQLQLTEDQIGQPVLPLESVVTQLPTVEELPDGVSEDIRHLKIQMRQLGSINPDAPREYTETKDRYDFLTNQMADLEAAARDLKAIVEELDKMMEQAFTETFVAVAKAFQNYFTLLFDGGEAQLILTTPEDVNETGVEIIARPPGKRPQNLELLSGGERSLTAQALIFALLKTSPTPYCIFDEVDAMLDEANVDRFRKALVALSQDIQFIIITHNRKTIETANTVYGIFMKDNGVSEAVSLKLDEFPEADTEALSLQFTN